MTDHLADLNHPLADQNDPLAELNEMGVSIWLDDLSRQRLVNGSLADLVAHQHVVGVTTTGPLWHSARRPENQDHHPERAGFLPQQRSYSPAAAWRPPRPRRHYSPADSEKGEP
jgi:hypothetical protein